MRDLSPLRGVDIARLGFDAEGITNGLDVVARALAKRDLHAAISEGQPERVYAILNSDLQNAEWGYVSFDGLRNIDVRGVEVDRDLHWKPRKASEIENIVQGMS